MASVGNSTMRVNVDELRRLFARLTGPEIEAVIDQLSRSKGMQAIISQAISENFEQEGPGWPPLKAQTIRSSVAKKYRKTVRRMSDERIAAWEEHAREGGPHAPQKLRQILQRTGTLKRAATTPGAPGNFYRVTGRRIEWGVSLIYAGIHNAGGTIKHPGTSNGFGMGIKIKPYTIPMPKREYMKISAKYLAELNEFAAIEFLAALRRILAQGGA